eukprot:gene46155-57551_t
MLRFPSVRMVIFSELAAYGASKAHAEEIGGTAETAFSKLAKRHSIWLIPGTLYEKAGDKIYNTAPVINPEGEIIARYRKMFPFQPFETGIDAAYGRDADGGQGFAGVHREAED